MSQQPSWLQPDDMESREDVTPLHPNDSVKSHDVEHSSDLKFSCVNLNDLPKKKSIFWVFKVITIALCLLMVLTALIGLSEINGLEESGRIFVASYMVFFASLLMVFEITQIRPCTFHNLN